MSYKIYPVTQKELDYDGYEIKVNGKLVKPDSARVSAFPINRRWPGHQRDLEQSELVNFLRLEMDEPLEFEIKPKKPFEKVEIRPVTLGIKPVVTDDGIIKFTLEKPAYFTVEPYERHNALHIFADALSDFNVDKNGDNVICFGEGVHEVGMINLESNQTLFIDEGAVVYACIHAKDATNIRILGRGILDNSHNKAKILFEAKEENNTMAVKNAKRTHTVQLEYCTNVEIDGITIRDSLVYNIRPIACNNVDIKNVKIIGCWRYNSDGIDMHNCVNVCIDNCFIRTFDDCICVKGFDCYYEGDVEAAVRKAMYRNGKSYDVFKNVVVKNCVLWNDWGKCLEIGAETRAEEMCYISFENCHVIHVIGTPLDCDNVDYADVHHLVYKDITVELDDHVPATLYQMTDDTKYENRDPDYAPYIITVEVVFHPEYSAGGERRGKNRDILFSNIQVFGRQQPKVYMRGYGEGNGVSNVTIKDFYWNGKKLSVDDVVFTRGKFVDNVVFE